MTTSSEQTSAFEWRAALSAFVFLSGACGLVYEIVWIRAIGLHFGTTAPAITTVLAAFMAGLALGNVLLGRLADRTERPLWLYSRLEIGIGLFGLLGSLLLLHGGPVLDGLARVTAAAGPLAGAVRFVFFALLLLVPTTLMGGTLPVLARALVRTGISGRVSGSLYALNTAGAVCGALAPDLLLVPWLGLTSAVAVAATVNLGIGLTAERLLASRGSGGAKEVQEAGAEPEPVVPAAASEHASGASRQALVLFAVSGFCAMGIEVLWSRVIEHWVAGLVTSFSVLLAVYLIGVATGSWATRALADRVTAPLVWAASILALVAPAVLLPLALASRWLTFFQELLPLPFGLSRPSLLRILLDALAHAAFLQGAATLLMGAAFPFLAAVAVRQGAAGRETGRLYAVNLLAGVLGSVVSGFVLLPGLGLQTSFMVLAGLAALVGGGVALLAGRASASADRGWRPPALAWTGLLGPAAVVVLAVLLPADHLRRAHFTGTAGEIVSLHEGATTTAAVVNRSWFGEHAYMELLTPGTTMSATNLESRRYMGLMGHLGLFLAAEPKSALLICYGVGNTAASLLSHPDLERLHVVDIAAEVLEASDEFASELGLDPLADPRVEVFVDDGRHHLVTTRQRYGVITSEPPPPNHAGVVNLYSREYYRLALRRLTPGGVLTQWLPVFQMAREETAAIVAAFVAEFPHTALFYGWGYQWILAGSDRPLAIDPEAWRARAEMPEVAADLAAIGVDGVGDLLGAVLQDDAGLRALVAHVQPVTDDQPTIQYPWRALGYEVEVPPGLLGDPSLVAELVPAAQRPRLAAYESHVELTRELVTALPWARMLPMEWWELGFGTALRPSLARRPGDEATLALLLLDRDRVRAAEAAFAKAPDPAAGLDLARRRFYDGDYVASLEQLRELDYEDRAPPRYWLLLGGCLRALGETEAAAEAFAKAAATSGWPPFKIAAQHLAETAGDPYPPELGPLGSGTVD